LRRKGDMTMNIQPTISKTLLFAMVRTTVKMLVDWMPLGSKRKTVKSLYE